MIKKFIPVAAVLVLIALVLSGLPLQRAEADPGWWDTDWVYKRKLTIAAGDVDSDLSNFPVLVHLSSSCGKGGSNLSGIFDGNTQDNGQDIRFTDSTEAPLDYEIEEWDNSGEEAWIWVNIPLVSSSSDTEFYMYYGNSGALDGQNATAVWDSHFKLVTHMKDDPDVSHVADSTGNNNDGTKVGTGWGAEVEAKIGKGQLHDGPTSGHVNGRSIRIDDDPSLHIADYITCEAWFNCEDTGVWRTIMSKFPEGTSQKDLYWFFNSGKVGAALHGPQNSDWIPGPTFTVGNWEYWVLTYDGSSITLYRNGSFTASKSVSGQLYLKDNTYYLYLGSNIKWGEYHKGKMDEVRISDIARSAEWIEAQHLSMDDNFITFGSEEKRPRAGGSSDSGGGTKDEYSTNEDVWVSASGFPPDSDVDVYVVNDTAWSDGQGIGPDVGDGMDTIHTDSSGDLGPVVIWPAPLDIGEYDVVFDADQNGDYDEVSDLVDNPNHPGFTVVSPMVGGEVYPINKAAVLMPWLGLAFTLILAVGGGTLALRKHRTQ